MGNADVAARHQGYADWCLVQDALAQRVSPQRHAAAGSAWTLWKTFCTGLGIDPLALGTHDPIPLLQLFAHRYRMGGLAPGRRSVRTRTVEDALRAVGQTYAGMGALDPRLNRHGELDFRLTALLQAWKRDDDPPTRVKPLPIAVVSHVWDIAQGEGTPKAHAAAACLVIGFYFLLRPGEYLGPPRAAVFRLCDIQFWIGSRALAQASCPAADLLAATFVALTFTQQKNGVRNETIGHGRSGHPHLCPVLCLASRVLALRDQGAAPTQTLNAFRTSPNAPFRFITPASITARIRAVLHLHPDPAYTFEDVSVPWHFYAPALTVIASDSSGAGAPTKCTDTYTCRRSPS